ncbi:DUF1345 domain-containing protein [Leucobacter muris]|jgi:uncharacterized membrane protein|uniref:DUF1345 domain-containing protein n=1 Tax=Leucobacter muris TaxID=1935379 RepID=A0ABX5QFT7_9MICO|nr:DUF1345 domain-containing protein [Leucobacter muris]QAB17957.1 DUF1345 domain-containing protein [Leucobacter muris]
MRRGSTRRRAQREFPIRYDDGFRGGIAMLVSAPVLAVPLIAFGRQGLREEAGLVLAALCATFSVFFLLYLLWTHRLFSRTAPADALRIAATQHRRGASRLSRVIGLKTAEDWSMTAALVALLVSLVAAAVGVRQGGMWLPLLVLLTVGTAWATVVYAFALRYFRLHAAGETIHFDIVESPGFGDFVSMAVMVSSVGAMSAGTPRTRAGLGTVRTHTFISFAFNALVVAMAVSLISSLIISG